MEKFDNWRELLTTSFDQFISTLSAYLPKLFGAIILLFVGVITAWLCRWLILRLGQGVDQMTQRLSIGSQYLKFRWPVSRITAAIIYWLIILFFITAVAESLGLPGIAEWLGQLIVYLPSILVALLIVWFGVILGNVIHEKTVSFAKLNDLLHGEQLAAAVRLIIIVLTVVIGLDQIGVHTGFVEQLFVITAAAVLFALALAFGLGAGPAMMNVIAITSVKQCYQVGDKIQLDDIGGEIQAFTRTAVVLLNEAGQLTVPAKLFQDRASLLLGMEGNEDG